MSLDDLGDLRPQLLSPNVEKVTDSAIGPLSVEPLETVPIRELDQTSSPPQSAHSTFPSVRLELSSEALVVVSARAVAGATEFPGARDRTSQAHT